MRLLAAPPISGFDAALEDFQLCIVCHASNIGVVPLIFLTRFESSGNNSRSFLRMPLVFVSYRRVDSAATAGRLYDRLVSKFGESRVFMDVEGSIPHGADFPDEIARALARASALVVVIGRQWLTCTDDQGRQRLHNDGDWVANELASAIERKILVLPVLVDGAGMPHVSSLPPGIAALARKQACDIRASSWDYDFQRIVSTLEPVLRQRSRRAQWVAASAAVAGLIVLGTFLYTTPVARDVPPPAISTAPGREPQPEPKREPPQTPRVVKPGPPIPAGQYTLALDDLSGAEGTSFEGSQASGFRLVAESGRWLNGRTYGHPAPYVYFVRDGTEKRAITGTLSLDAGGHSFLFDSIEIYSSVERTPYQITGYLGERSVLKIAGIVPNTFGNFARIGNSEMATVIDRLSIGIETYTENAVSNRVGIDNVVVRVPNKSGS